MSTHKSIDLICVAVLLLTLLLTVLFINGERLGIRVIVDEDAEGASGSAYFTGNDLNGDWDSASATVITLNGDTAEISGGGAYYLDGDVIISSAGGFVLRGSLDDGSVIVDAENRSKVWLLLDGVDLKCSDDACLRINQADKVFLTLAAGSDNRMTGGAAYSETALADGTDGVIFSHDDLTVNGSGSLTVTANCLHALSVNDELVITGGKLKLSAPEDAVHANDALRICGAELSLEAGDDGLYLKNPGGLLYLESGRLSIDAGGDAVHSASDVRIAGGELRIRAADDAVHSDAGIALAGGTVSIEECYEGLEALTIDISGGELTVLCTDDGLNANGGPGGFAPFSEQTAETAAESWIHISGGSVTVINETARDADGLDSNGDLIITGGSVRVSLPGTGSNNALDYGSESGGVCLISGGEVVACGSSSMAEGFSAESGQCSLLYTCAQQIPAGTEVSLEDAEGVTLLRYTPPCAFNSLILSCPGMQLDRSYRLRLGGSAEELTLTEVSALGGVSVSDGFGRPDMGKGAEDGEQPFGVQPPEGEQMSPPPQRPDGEQMGTPPQRPGFDSQPPEGGQMGPRPDGQNFGGTPAEAAENAAAETAAEQTAFAPDAETWILLALSFLALCGGVLLAARFEP